MGTPLNDLPLADQQVIAAIAVTNGAAKGDLSNVPENILASITGVWTLDGLGAAGDGVTNDLPVLETFISVSRPGAKLVGSPGKTYAIAGTWLITTDNREFDGRGATIIRGANGGDMIGLQASSWKIHDLVINGGRGQGTYISGNTGLFITGAHNDVIRVTSHDNFDHGIAIDGKLGAAKGDHNLISRCICYNNGQVGLSEFQGTANKREFNEVYSNGAEGITIDATTTQATVVFNTLDNNALIGAVGGIGIDGSAFNTVLGNVVTNTQNGLPGICLQCEDGDTSWNKIAFNDVQGNTGGGIWARYYHQTYPTVDATKTYQSNFNTFVGNNYLNNTGFSLKIDAHCAGNIVSAERYNGMLPTIDPASVGTQLEMGAGAEAFRVATNAEASNITGDGSWAQIVLTGVERDVIGSYSASTGLFTAPVTGIYAFDVRLRLEYGNGHGFAEAELRQAGSDTKISGTSRDFASNVFGIEFATTFRLAAGDTVALYGRSGGGPGTKTMGYSADGSRTAFEGYLIG